MSLIDSLTPKNTEEVKPGLFIQTIVRNNKTKYRAIKPIAWNGKLLWREQIKTIFTVRTIITLLIVLFLAWSYSHDNRALMDFHNSVVSDPIAFCTKIHTLVQESRCDPFLEKNGLCNMTGIKKSYNG